MQKLTTRYLWWHN